MDMPTWEIIAFIITLLIMLAGLLGTILPLLPGTPLILIVAFLYALITDFHDITWHTIAVLVILTGVSIILDYLANVIGIKKMGGSWFGVLGAFAGMIIGLLIPGAGIVGFIIGAFAGAVVFEMLLGRKFNRALKAGIGSFIGFIFGGVIRFAIAAVMIGIFVYNILMK